MVLVCHVILRDKKTKGLSNTMDSSPSRVVTILPSFVTICTVVLKCNGFSLSRDPAIPNDQRVM